MSATARESWGALMEDGQLVEMMLDQADQGRLLGDIYLGKVDAVLPGIQAAFIDIGSEKAGFLHVSDLETDDEDDENGGSGVGGEGVPGRARPSKMRFRRARRSSYRSPRSL